MFKQNRNLYNFLKNPSNLTNFQILRESILLDVSTANVSPSNILLLENKLKSFCAHLRRKWIRCGYKKNYFLKKHEDWLNRSF